MKKRLLSLLIAAVLILSPVCGAVFSGATAVIGDADGDGVLTVFDATAIQRHLVGLDVLSADAVSRAIVSGEKELSIFDATYIQRRLVGIITCFPCEEGQSGTEPSTEPEDEVTKVQNNITIYFSNNLKWQTVNAYVYKQSTGAAMSTWPGSGMQLYTTNTYNEQVYSLTVDVTQYDRIIFNNGTDQTTDTPLTKASSGYFIDPIGKDKAYSGNYIAGVYPYGTDAEGHIDTVVMDYTDGYEKKIYIWTPEGYDPADKTKKYSVLYMCDGQNLFGQEDTLSGYEWECDESVLSLMQNGGDGIIVVGIACGETEALRNHELTPNLGQLAPIVGDATFENGGGKVFSDFVVNEVIPYVEQNYHTNSIRGIAGSSSGGIEAFYIGMENPSAFRYIGALSPAFVLYNKTEWDAYLNTKDFSGEMPRIYFFCGNSPQDQLEQALYTNAVAMEGWMKNHGYPADKMTTVTDSKAVHNEGFWALYFPEMLSWCLDL